MPYKQEGEGRGPQIVRLYISWLVLSFKTESLYAWTKSPGNHWMVECVGHRAALQQTRSLLLCWQSDSDSSVIQPVQYSLH